MTKLRAVVDLGMSGGGWTKLKKLVRSSPTARRSSRDDKVEGSGRPWHEWRWMDRVEKS
jgi:hypothetical protein